MNTTDQLKREWNESSRSSEFSTAHLKQKSRVERVIDSSTLRFLRVFIIASLVLLVSAAFLSQRYTAMIIAVSICLALTVPMVGAFILSVRTLRSLDFSADVATSLERYRSRIARVLKVQRTLLLFLIIITLATAFFVGAEVIDGFEIAATVGTYTMILVSYGYRSLDRSLVNELRMLEQQLKGL